MFAKSFARIHRRNLVAQGILALTFVDEDDYDRAEVGETWTLPDVQARSSRRAPTRSPSGSRSRRRELSLDHDFAPKEREILLQRRPPPATSEEQRAPPTPAWIRACVRERFPALAGGAAFFDGPGGSQVPAGGDRRGGAYLRGSNANLGGAFAHLGGVRPRARSRARAAAADFTGSEPEGSPSART